MGGSGGAAWSHPVKEIVIIDGARTAFGTYGGQLRDTSATDLGVVAAKAALERSKVDPKQIEHVIFGNVLQTSGDAVYFARHIGLKSGVPKEVPALTVNRLCGSGLQAILLGAQEIQLGQADFVLAGGAENMSMAPHQIRGARWGLPLGEQKLEDYLWVALVDSYNGLGMANTAENLGRKYGITRVAPDIMGIGPAPSSRQALERAGLKVSDMDLVEINEAFATQYLAVEKDLGLDREKTNVNGGAIALGHPLGASGARLALTLMYELRKREKRYGLASLCIGGGQGIAAVFERV